MSLSLFRLLMKFMPLVPKAERRKLIEAVTLPPSFEGFRTTLFELCEKAPEIHSRDLGDFLTFGMGEKATVEVIKPPTVTSAGP